MTDKIIIDGVDVSECDYYFDEICRCMNSCFNQDFYTCPQCKDVENCYYKQLKRSQNALQEIKTLVTTDYIQIKKQLVQNYDCLDNFMQKIEDKCGEIL